jgi:urease accessory protein UreF
MTLDELRQETQLIGAQFDELARDAERDDAPAWIVEALQAAGARARASLSNEAVAQARWRIQAREEGGRRLE